jgi:rhodanese-related sulfurtransferase
MLLDIRTKEEFCRGHLPGAKLVPTQLPVDMEAKLLPARELSIMEDILWNVTRHLSKLELIQVYCKKGKRAGLAVEMLLKMGFKNVVSLGSIETMVKNDPGLKLCYCQNIH